MMEVGYRLTETPLHVISSIRQEIEQYFDEHAVGNMASVYNGCHTN
jgi:hypothetical protein